MWIGFGGWGYFVTPTELCALLSFFDQSKGIADVNFMCIFSAQSSGLHTPRRPPVPHTPIRTFCIPVNVRLRQWVPLYMGLTPTPTGITPPNSAADARKI